MKIRKVATKTESKIEEEMMLKLTLMMKKESGFIVKTPAIPKMRQRTSIIKFFSIRME